MGDDRSGAEDGRRLGLALTDCIFCTRDDQPPSIFETESLYVMPDKYPLRQGHVLIVSKQYLRCFAEAPDDLLAELDAVAERIRRFLEASYGVPVPMWENGVSGQRGFHAPLHLFPPGTDRLPAGTSAHE